MKREGFKVGKIEGSVGSTSSAFGAASTTACDDVSSIVVASWAVSVEGRASCAFGLTNELRSRTGRSDSASI